MRIISQAEARQQGLTRFFTSKPCIRGHIAPRQTSNFRCVECGFIKSRQYEKQHPEIRNAAIRRQYRQLRSDVLQMLGGKCSCCGETEPTFLCVDHINGGGNRHRKALGSVVILRWLRQQLRHYDLEPISREYRVLCSNCNLAYASLGYCPHIGKTNGS